MGNNRIRLHEPRCANGLWLTAIMLSATLSMPMVFFQQTATVALASEVSDAETAYEEASALVNQLTAEYDKTAQQVSDLDAQITSMRDVAASELVTSYKTSIGGDDVMSVATAVTSSDSVSQLTSAMRYGSDMSNEMSSKVASLLDLREQASAKRQELESKVKDAQAAADDANQKYQKTKAAQEAKAKAASSATTVQLSTVDWSADKTSFVDTWGTRIDRYLSGSPLYGYGKVFAANAYDCNIDPRISPAISNVESSKGAVCFRPHNAWGLMGKSFSTWEEAIAYHCRYMAGPLYHGTINASTARTYCPPTWQSWLSKVQGEMAKI